MTQRPTSLSSTQTTLIRPHSELATQKHAEDLATRLSFLDRREIEVYNPGTTPLSELTEGVAKSADAQALVDEQDRTLAIWGVVELQGVNGDPFGAPWLLSAEPEEYSAAAKVRLVKDCKASLENWHKSWRRLEGYSWANAVEHHKLLRLLDFELSPIIDRNDAGQALAAPTIMFARHLDFMEAGEAYYVRDR